MRFGIVSRGSELNMDRKDISKRVEYLQIFWNLGFLWNLKLTSPREDQKPQQTFGSYKFTPRGTLQQHGDAKVAHTIFEQLKNKDSLF